MNANQMNTGRGYWLAGFVASALSVIALLAFLGRAFWDCRYENRYLGPRCSTLEAIYLLGYIAFAGGWGRAMLAAIRGCCRGLLNFE